MTAWHGGKGDGRRPEGTPGAYGNGFDAIDWGARRGTTSSDRTQGTQRKPEGPPSAPKPPAVPA